QRQGQHVDAVERHRPVDDAARLGDKAQGREHGDALARAGLADEPHHLAAADAEVDTVDGLHDAVGSEEPRPQPGDLEQRLAHLLSRGSRASRSPSPRRVKASTLMAIMMPGNSTRKKGVNTLFRSAASIDPHSAVGGCTPKPRKDSAATSSTAVAMPSVACTTSGVSEFGNTRCHRMRRLETPRARSAATKSCSRIDSTLA